MSDRSIFNRKYTGFTSDGTQVFLVNGAGAGTTGATSTRSFTAGEDLIQGAAVFVSGVYVLNANAGSGEASTNFNVIGLTNEAASTNDAVTVVLDDLVTVSSENIAAATALTPGQYYFLSKFDGQIVEFDTTSGTIAANDGYGALVNLGTAVSTSELSLEIQPIVELFGPGNTGPVPAPTTQNFIAGVDLIQGDVVYVSGTNVYPASAASGQVLAEYSPVGITSASASASASVPVIFDDIASIAAVNITAESALTPGEYYYLSKFDGQLVRYSSASGLVSQASGYAALVNMGLALSTSAFHVQIQAPVEIYT